MNKMKREDDAVTAVLLIYAPASAFTQEEESRIQAEEEMGLKVSFEGSNQLSIPVKTLSGRWVLHHINHALMPGVANA